MMSRSQEDPQSGVGVLHEVSSLLLKILRSPPPPVAFSDHVLELSSVISSSSSRILPSSQMTSAGFASLLLGISLALMLCGSPLDVGTLYALLFNRSNAPERFQCLETNVNMKKPWVQPNQIVELFARGWSARGLQEKPSKGALVNEWTSTEYLEQTNQNKVEVTMHLVEELETNKRRGEARLTNVEMNLDGEQEDANETEVEKRMNDDSSSAGVKVAELQAPSIPGSWKSSPGLRFQLVGGPAKFPGVEPPAELKFPLRSPLPVCSFATRNSCVPAAKLQVEPLISGGI
ncbi:hypothetical protein SDJN03_12440, partial [Cucurbita argyrosperma subsp. sororia]